MFSTSTSFLNPGNSAGNGSGSGGDNASGANRVIDNLPGVENEEEITDSEDLESYPDWEWE
jgi:hypothetical protein